MEESGQQQQIQGSHFGGQQANTNDKTQTNGSSTHIKLFSKTDLFNNLNTEMSEIHDNELYSQDMIGKIMGEDKISPSQIHSIVQQAISPYLEKIRQLEEIQQQKDNQITALFYTVKKMDEIIKKIESEQSKATTTRSTASTARKTTTIGSSTATTTAGTTRSSSNARSSQIRSTDLSQSTMLPSQTGGGLTKKPSVPSLLDSKKSGQNMSKSTLHEPIGNRGESAKTSKVGTPAARGSKEGKDGIPEIKKIVKSKLGNNESEPKGNSSTQEQKQKKSETSSVSNQNTVEAQNNTVSSIQESINANTTKVDVSNYHTAPPLLLHDLNDDEHLIESVSQKNYGSDKEDSGHKHLLNNSNNLNEDSMLI